MFPTSDLERLATRKERLRRRIAHHRDECVRAGTRLASTVRVIDAWRERLSRWSGFASAVLPFFLKSRAELAKPRPKSKVAGALRWAKLGWQVAKGLRPLTYAFRGE